VAAHGCLYGWDQDGIKYAPPFFPQGLYLRLQGRKVGRKEGRKEGNIFVVI
jgi:hypothetical protein